MGDGIIITLEGPDGSGKQTQADMLVERLRREGHFVHKEEFPLYSSFDGRLLKEHHLAGKGGDPTTLDPYLVSYPFAMDRARRIPAIETALDQGMIVVCDRYTGSNLAHQGAKLGSVDERARYYDWTLELEHEVNGLPRQDITLFLDVPTQVSLRNTASKMRDAHELDEGYQRRVLSTYHELADRFGWEVVRCYDGDHMRPTDHIHADIMERLDPLLAHRSPCLYKRPH